MDQAPWEMLPRPVRVAIGVACGLFALPFAFLTLLALLALGASITGQAEGGVVPTIFGGFLAGLLAFALGAVAWRMLRSPGASA